MSAIHRDALHDVLDARAANDEQEDLLLNLATPEADSAIELALLIPCPDIKARMLRMLHQIHASNSAEGFSECAAAGILDRAAAAGYQAESQRSGVRVRDAANRLRPVLGTADALSVVRDLDAVMARRNLIGSGMANELGRRKYRRLLDLVERLDAGRAAA